MADRLAGGVRAGSTGYSTQIVLRSTTDNSEMTGKVAANITATYWRQGGSPAAITLADLVSLTDAWASGGVKEVDAVLMRGTYRLDVPDAALATGADWVELNAFCSGSFVFKERLALESKNAADNNVLLAATAANPPGIKKNTALPNFTVLMVDAAGNPKTGLAVLAERSLDGAAFVTCANPVTEVSGGVYKITLAAADLNGDVVTLRFTAALARQQTITIITEP
jgi:hypothetical protein